VMRKRGGCHQQQDGENSYQTVKSLSHCTPPYYQIIPQLWKS